MVELEATTQKGDEVLVRWRKEMPAGSVTLGRLPNHADWAVPEDEQLSRKHAVLSWDNKTHQLLVNILPTARNPVYCDGQRFTAGQELKVQVGHRFIIGETIFNLAYVAPPTPPPPASDVSERTCSPEEARSLPYADADKRIEVLSALPEMIRHSASNTEFEERVVEVLLKGMPRAQFAALVRMDRESASPTAKVHVLREARRAGFMQAIQPSRQLVHSAIYKYFKVAIHRWGDNQDSKTDLHNPPSVGVEQWAICVPLTEDDMPGRALYAAGAEVTQPNFLGPTPGQLENGDIKFVVTVAEMVGALGALRDLQKKQALLSRFFSPAVMSALAGQDMEQVLNPRVSDVTVMCCDLRGSSRIAEEGESDLAATCDRVIAALQEMTTPITAHDGVISDFQGDAAMSFWGWPHSPENFVDQAAKAALEIRRGFKLKASMPGHPLAKFACGLGLATGPGVVGRLGTVDQFKIGVFGPTINLAARLEGLTKEFNVSVLADDATAQRLKGKTQFRLRRLAQVRPVGMTKQIMVHEIMPMPSASDPTIINENQRMNYEAALDRFTSGEWSKADELLARATLQSDGPSLFLRKYMRDRQMKPPTDWAGVVVMTHK